MGQISKITERLSFRPGELKKYFTSPPQPHNLSDMRKTLLTFVFIRVAILTLIIGSKYWLMFNSPTYANYVNYPAWLIVSIYLFSILNFVAIQRLAHIALIGFIQLISDVIFISLALYMTGSYSTTLLYLLVIAGSSLIYSAHGAVILAALSALGYSLIVSGLIPSAFDNNVSLSVTELLSVYASLVSIALVSGYFAKQLVSLNRLATTSQEHLSALTESQNNLINDLIEGVIRISAANTVVAINDSARMILNLTANETHAMIGVPLKQVLKSLDMSNICSELDDRRVGEPQVEGEFIVQKEDREQVLSFRLSSLKDSTAKDADKLLFINDVSHLRQIENRLSLHERMTRLLSSAESIYTEEDSGSVRILGESPLMAQLQNLITKLAKSSASVLIWGESGTGKELIARSIHYRGKRNSKPYIAVNCGAIPESLIESELFGHKRGSFTGAIADNLGLFRRAHGGTIFLDEIGELPLILQTKLLRVLQEKTVRAVGDSKDVPIDVRVISATNKDLRREIELGNFREDLYYRLNVVNLFVPPLRERHGDIELLVRYFLQRAMDRDDTAVPQISPEALELLLKYPFPGNVRELENVIERAVVLGGQAILPEHLPDEVQCFKSQKSDANRTNGTANGLTFGSQQTPGHAPDTIIKILPIDLEAELSKLEKDYLERALQEAHGIKKNAADLLGLNFRSFRYRLKKYGMSIGAGDNDD